MTTTNYHRLTNGTVYSYSTCIRQEVGDLSIGNITRYSTTTSRHQSQAQCVSCDVVLDDVPQDTPELLTLAMERGLVYEVYNFGWDATQKDNCHSVNYHATVLQESHHAKP